MHWKHHKLHNLHARPKTGRSCSEGSMLSRVSLVHIYPASVISERRGTCAEPKGYYEQCSPDPRCLHTAKMWQRMQKNRLRSRYTTECTFFFPGSANPKFILLHSTFFSLRWIHGLKGLPLSAEGGLASPFEVCSVITQRQTLSRYGLT